MTACGSLGFFVSVEIRGVRLVCCVGGCAGWIVVAVVYDDDDDDGLWKGILESIVRVTLSI
jgi:hypothetical protein